MSKTMGKSRNLPWSMPVEQGKDAENGPKT